MTHKIERKLPSLRKVVFEVKWFQETCPIISVQTTRKQRSGSVETICFPLPPPCRYFYPFKEMHKLTEQ